MNMQTPKLSPQDVFDRWNQPLSLSQMGGRTYYAMYSSWLQGIVTDPRWMLVPVDDHLVHRGDGVFEAMKIVHGGVYLLEEHLQRFFASGKKIGLGADFTIQQIREVILQTSRVAFEGFREKNPSAKPEDFSAIVRLFLSRGPGSFTPNPYDTQGNQIYCIITENKNPAAEKYKNGVKIGRSHIAVKQDWFPTVKSCNYLPNVLMKKESVDRKLDFTVSFTSDNFLSESATENIFILDAQNRLRHPHWESILRGTTMVRAFELAQSLEPELQIAGAGKISEKELLEARGVFMVGTTLDILPVSEYEGRAIPIPKVHEKMLAILRQDQQVGSSKHTPIF